MNGMRGIENDFGGRVPALQAGEVFVGVPSRGFTPGCHITGFQPSAADTPADFPARSCRVRTN